MSRKWLAALAAMVALALAAGCGQDDDDESGGGGGGEVENVPGFDGKTIKLGILTPLTGPVVRSRRSATGTWPRR